MLQHDRVCEARTSDRLFGEFVSRYFIVGVSIDRESKSE